MIISIAMGADTIQMVALKADQKAIQHRLLGLTRQIRTAKIESDLEYARELCELEDELKAQNYDIGVILRLVDVSKRSAQTTQENVRDMNHARQLYKDYCAKYNNVTV